MLEHDQQITSLDEYFIRAPILIIISILLLDIHLDLEDKLASFLGVEQAKVFNCSFTTISSCIQACAKKGDVIFA